MVVIGIDRYDCMPRLSNAVSDAEGALALFQRLGFTAEIPPLIDAKATGHALRKLVTDDLSSLGSGDSLILFFAGHGSTRTQQIQDLEVKSGYLLPADAQPDQYATWIDLDQWLEQLARLPARHILVIIDACHSGLALGKVVKYRDIRRIEPGELSELDRRVSRHIITSAGEDQLAIDSGPVPGHSLFTGCLIEGLSGGIPAEERGVVTSAELGLYLQRRVSAESHRAQTPDFGTLAYDKRGQLLIPIGDSSASPYLPAAAHDPNELTSMPKTASLVMAGLYTLALGLMLGFALRDEEGKVARQAWDVANREVNLGAEGIERTERELVRRVALQDVAVVRALLQAGVDANAQEDTDLSPCWFGNARATALTRAVIDGDVEISKLLLEANADASSISLAMDRSSTLSPERRSPLPSEAVYRSPLLIASRCARKNHFELVMLLLSHHASAAISTELGETVLFECRVPRAVKALVAAGANPNAVSKSSLTALIVAVMKGDAELVDALLSAGADPNLAGAEGSPLQVAAAHHPELISALLAAGAVPRVERAGALLLTTLGDGSAARVAAAAALVRRGVSLDSRLDGLPLLEYALQARDLGALRGLFRLGADVRPVLQLAHRALLEKHHADALEWCSLVADSTEDADAAWICAQAACGLGDRRNAARYAARAPAELRATFEEVCAALAP